MSPIIDSGQTHFTVNMEWWPRRYEDLKRSHFRKADAIAKRLIRRCEADGLDGASESFSDPPIIVRVERIHP